MTDEQSDGMEPFREQRRKEREEKISLQEASDRLQEIQDEVDEIIGDLCYPAGLMCHPDYATHLLILSTHIDVIQQSMYVRRNTDRSPITKGMNDFYKGDVVNGTASYLDDLQVVNDGIGYIINRNVAGGITVLIFFYGTSPLFIGLGLLINWIGTQGFDRAFVTASAENRSREFIKEMMEALRTQ